jgi:hypothetical protein
MSRKHNPYLFYTEYYLISGAYQVINVVNGILTYSASYSDNIKEYLRNQVASKQVALNQLIRNEQDSRVNAKHDNDVDEDGFVVIKMRKPKPKNADPIHTHTHTHSGDSHVASLPVISLPIHDESLSSLTQTPIPIPFQSESESNIKEECNVLLQKVIEQVMRNIISDVIIKVDALNE